MKAGLSRLQDLRDEGSEVTQLRHFGATNMERTADVEATCDVASFGRKYRVSRRKHERVCDVNNKAVSRHKPFVISSHSLDGTNILYIYTYHWKDEYEKKSLKNILLHTY